MLSFSGTVLTLIFAFNLETKVSIYAGNICFLYHNYWHSNAFLECASALQEEWTFREDACKPVKGHA